MFKYCWIWQKNRHSSPLLAKKQPLRIYEDVCVFYRKQSTYNPQGVINIDKPMKNSKSSCGEIVNGRRGDTSFRNNFTQTMTGYPTQIIQFKSDSAPVHGTQKPVALFEYLIKTYTNEGELVLDNCAGSGTTGVACINTGRDYILMEKDKDYYDLILKRLNKP
jgi:site-specific DNA-methyltransferase (adenine-specific)